MPAAPGPPRPAPRSTAAGLATPLAVLGALVLFGLLYRLRLGLMLGDTFASEIPAPLRAVLRQSAVDAMFALGIAALVLLFGQLGAALGLQRRPAGRLVGCALAGLVVLGVGIFSQAQYGCFFATGNGLTAQLFEESLSWPAIKELLVLMTPGEYLFICVPLALFVGLLFLPAPARRWADRAVVALMAAAVLTAGLVPTAPLPDALLHHPVGYIAIDLARSKLHTPLFGEGLVKNAGASAKAPALADAQLGPGAADDSDSQDDAALAADLSGALPPTMALSTPLFVYPESERPITKTLPEPPPSGDPSAAYNILYVLMESTGLDYALKPIGGSGDKVAMPFLRSIAQQGLLLSNHYSSGNSSPRGIFSLLSGLYVMPEVGIFDVRKDNYLPSLATYLGERYHPFLVTPASLDWYFPHAFLLHSGMSELWGYHAIPVHKNAPGGRSHARDEAETVGFFLRKLDEHAASGAPFLAVYYSFIAHWPYPDYGPDTHVASPTRPLNAYYNNLHYLDSQLERIFKHLGERKLLERTIVVIVGDHGEAFGQHANNYTHSRMSYNENLRTPAVLYQPSLFPPRVVTAPTSHVDIVPTLLDALSVPYDPRYLQGESLFQEQFRRRYIFTYGNEDTLTSVSAAEIKLQLSLRDGSCWVYDLKSDPEEHRRLPCQGRAHAEQQQALLVYRRQQQSSLRRYNQLIRRQGLRLLTAPVVGEKRADYRVPALRHVGHSP